MIRIQSLLLLFLLLGVSAGSARADGPTLNERLVTFGKALRSKDPKARARAFDYLRGVPDPDVVPAILGGMKKVVEEGERIRKEQTKTDALYTKAINDMQAAQNILDTSAGSSRDMAAFNKKEGKIRKAREGAVMSLKNLENDFSRNRALSQQAILALAESLAVMDDAALETALAMLSSKWLESSDVEDRLRFVDAICELKRPVVSEVLNGIVSAEEQPTAVRVAAIDALAARADGGLFGKVLEMLKLPVDQQPFLIAAIGVLRRMHDRRSIPPLIEFLAREDLKRTRDDAYKALMSLTGQNHGKYSGEWKKWWDEHGQTFDLPENPRPTGDLEQPGEGGTFYGIHTSSDRILYIVDISGSMDKPQKGADGKSKWDVLKQELTGAVLSLNETDSFNVIFFNHQVIPWQSRKVLATERNKKLLKQWVDDQTPLGGTNISDSLHDGFAMAAAVTGPPALDTVFFLTDGKPTAGKTWDPERILEIFREWNQTMKLTIHTIGIGEDHDAAFMQELARIGDGRYVKR